MRWLPVLAAAGCSFSHGSSSEQAAGSADAPIDTAGSGSARMDSGSGSATPDARICPSSYVTLTGAPATSKYRVFNWDNSTSMDQSQPWLTAKQTCITDGTHLAIPNDMAELSALRQNITVDPQSNYLWIGLTDAATEGTWLTVLGDPAPYLAWYPGQPNNGGGPGGSGQQEDCAMTSPAAPDMWDWTCGTPYPFACECEQ